MDYNTQVNAIAALARNNINILDVKYDADCAIIGVEFEYGWKITPVSTKWTRSFMEPHNTDDSLCEVYTDLIHDVKAIRDLLEG